MKLILIIIFILIAYLFTFSLCRVAGDADRQIEKFMDEEINKEIYEDME